MNQVKNMSHSEVHADEKHQAEKESRLPRWRSIMLKESAEDASIGN